MTPTTEPTIDEILDNLACASHFLVDDKCIYCDDIKLKSLISDQVAKARIDELNRIPRTNYGNDFAIHINAYLDDRIAELKGV